LGRTRPQALLSLALEAHATPKGKHCLTDKTDQGRLLRDDISAAAATALAAVKPLHWDPNEDQRLEVLFHEFQSKCM
jgi:hypothetical protein